MAVWSSRMIPVLGTGGHGFNSRCGPAFFSRSTHREKCKKIFRAHPGLNQGPLALQANALPLSYGPDIGARSAFQGSTCRTGPDSFLPYYRNSVEVVRSNAVALRHRYHSRSEEMPCICYKHVRRPKSYVSFEISLLLCRTFRARLSRNGHRTRALNEDGAGMRQ